MGKFWAGGFLYDPLTGSLFLHKRDGIAPINPNKWAFFGGENEGPETSIEFFIRELYEEIGLKIEPGQADTSSILSRISARGIFRAKHVTKSALRSGEGPGFDWHDLRRAFELDLTNRNRDPSRGF